MGGGEEGESLREEGRGKEERKLRGGTAPALWRFSGSARVYSAKYVASEALCVTERGRRAL